MLCKLLWEWKVVVKKNENILCPRCMEVCWQNKLVLAAQVVNSGKVISFFRLNCAFSTPCQLRRPQYNLYYFTFIYFMSYHHAIGRSITPTKKPIILDHMTGSTCAFIEVLHWWWTTEEDPFPTGSPEQNVNDAHIVPVPKRNRYPNHILKTNI